MQAQLWATILSAFSFIITMLVAFFIMGTRWSKVGEHVKNIEWRLTRIEALFRLQLKQNGQANGDNH